MSVAYSPHFFLGGGFKMVKVVLDPAKTHYLVLKSSNLKNPILLLRFSKKNESTVLLNCTESAVFA